MIHRMVNFHVSARAYGENACGASLNEQSSSMASEYDCPVCKQVTPALQALAATEHAVVAIRMTLANYGVYPECVICGERSRFSSTRDFDVPVCVACHPLVERLWRLYGGLPERALVLTRRLVEGWWSEPSVIKERYTAAWVEAVYG